MSPRRPDGWVRVGRRLVDAPALRGLEHRCDPVLCRNSGSCCARYEQWLEPGESRRIRDALPRAAGFAPHLRNPGGGFRRVCRREGEGGCRLLRREDGLCILAYRDRRRRVLCSLHSAALHSGEDPAGLKPRGCVLWPLTESGSPPVISVQPDARQFPCNTSRAPRKGLGAGVIRLLRAALGEGFARELQRRIQD